MFPRITSLTYKCLTGFVSIDGLDVILICSAMTARPRNQVPKVNFDTYDTPNAHIIASSLVLSSIGIKINMSQCLWQRQSSLKHSKCKIHIIDYDKCILHRAKIHYWYVPRRPESHLLLTLYCLHLSNQTMVWQGPRLSEKSQF